MAGLPARGGIGGKLSLKRRREDRGGVAGTFSTNASWFEKQELSEAEASWITLLRTVDPHLNQSKILKLRILNPLSKHLIAEPRPLNGFHSQFITETEKPAVQEGVETVRLKKQKPFPQEKMTKMRHKG